MKSLKIINVFTFVRLLNGYIINYYGLSKNTITCYYLRKYLQELIINCVIKLYMFRLKAQ